MQTVFTGSNVDIAIAFTNAAGEPELPASASYRVVDEREAELVASTSIALDPVEPNATVMVDQSVNTLAPDQARALRNVIVSYELNDGTVRQVEFYYIVTAAVGLVPGLNAFASLGAHLMHLQEMPHLKLASKAQKEVLSRFIAAAYVNIGALRVEFPGYHRLSSTREFTAEQLTQMDKKLMHKLLSATLIEADYLMGGDPVEERRKSGLLSHSAGESAHFLRPTKPIDLPVCKETARALSPHVSYSLRVVR